LWLLHSLGRMAGKKPRTDLINDKGRFHPTARGRKPAKADGHKVKERLEKKNDQSWPSVSKRTRRYYKKTKDEKIAKHHGQE